MSREKAKSVLVFALVVVIVVVFFCSDFVVAKEKL